jgi:ribonuclease HI
VRNDLNAGRETRGPVARIYIDGAGMRPDGTGSGYGWMDEHRGIEFYRQRDGLTNNQAEYRALLSAVKHLPQGSVAEMFTDSELICYQFEGSYKVRDPKLKKLLTRVYETIKQRQVKVTLSWVRRERNLAGKLLERRRAMDK